MNTITSSAGIRTPSSVLNEGGNSCSLKGGLLFSYGIKGVLPLLHAGPGCSFCAYFGQGLHSGESYPFANTAMCNNEVIFGGEKLLHKALFAAQEVHNPELIAVIAGCQPRTIGDDIENVVLTVLEQGIACEVIVAGTSGYDGDLYHGFIKTGLSFLKHFCQKKPIRKKLVNIIGFPTHIDIYWKGNLAEIRQLVLALGLEINCFFPGDATLTQLRDIPAAELNLVVDEQLGTAMAEYLRELYGTPYVAPPFGSLIGADNTYEFFSNVIKQLNLSNNLCDVLEEKKRRALKMTCQSYHLWTELIQYSINTFAVNAHASMALGMTRLLMCEFGLEPKVINLNPSYPGSREKLLDLLEKDGRGFQPIILEDQDNYVMSQAFANDWPAVILGKGTSLKSDAFVNNTRVIMAISYPALDRIMIYNRPLMGFNGVPSMLDDIMNRAAYFF